MDTQARKDALADAETLLNVSAQTRGKQSDTCFTNLMAARTWAEALNGVCAARAAFRAVPGLREE